MVFNAIISFVTILLVSSATCSEWPPEIQKTLDVQFEAIDKSGQSQSLHDMKSQARRNILIYDKKYKSHPVAEGINQVLLAINIIESSLQKIQSAVNNSEIIVLDEELDKMNQTAKNLDGKLYGKPTIFDLIVQYEDEMDCSINQKLISIEQIKLVFNLIARFERLKIDDEILIGEELAKKNYPIAYENIRRRVATATLDKDMLFSRFQKRMANVYWPASNSLTRTLEKLEKCEEQDYI